MLLHPIILASICLTLVLFFLSISSPFYRLNRRFPPANKAEQSEWWKVDREKGMKQNVNYKAKSWQGD